MDPTSESTAQLRIPASSNRHSDEIPCSEVFGFQVAANRYTVLSESAVQSSGRVQGYSSLVNPRTTPLQRLQAAQEEAARGNSTSGGILELFTPSVSDAQENLYNVEPVASNSAPAFFHSFNSLSVQTNELGTGDFLKDAVYNSDVKDVDCIQLKCNKRISDAGQERSAGRPGHTPTRRDFVCVKHMEDSCAGQEWSAGRPGTGPLGASDPACQSSVPACVGPYGTARTQPHPTGINTRNLTSTSTTASPGLSQPRDQFNPVQFYTSANSSRGHAVEDRASPAMVALQPRRPPYFCGGIDDDVHVWTAIVDRWLGAIQGEPSEQLTFLVSLLRGAAYEWYQHFETRTGCPGDWTTLRHAMLERFGTSIRAEKARAGVYQLRQGKMTVLQYAAAFESFLAQMGDYDEAQYLIHFIFGLRPEIMRGVYILQPDSLLAAKNMAERLELTHHLMVGHPVRTQKKKDIQSPA